jgi:hypothetical protein
MLGGMPVADNRCMDSIIIYCRPRDGARTHTLRTWLEQQAAALSDLPEIERTTVVRLTGPGHEDGREYGWLLDCELADGASPPSDALGELMTDMRMVGFAPVIFMAQPQPA